MKPLLYNDVDCPVFQYALEQYKLNAQYSHIDIQEFIEEYQRYWFLIKILVVYRNSQELNVRLLVNHLIVLSNNFGQASAQILLKIVLEKGDYDIIRYTLSILNFIGYIPEDKHLVIVGEEYHLDDVPMDYTLLKLIEEKIYETE